MEMETVVTRFQIVRGYMGTSWCITDELFTLRRMREFWTGCLMFVGWLFALSLPWKD